MGEWTEYTLGDIADVIGGGTPSTSNPNYWNGNIPWLTPRDLTGYKSMYIDKGERNITELGLSNSSARLLPKNSVLLTSRAPIGYVVIAKNEICTNQGFKNLILNEKIANATFIYYWLINNVDYLQSIGTGTTFAEISGSTVKAIKILLPPLVEQIQIATILNCLDDKIDLLQRQNKTLEQLAETLFRQWFVEELDEDWEFVSLGQLISVKHGYAFKGENISTELSKFILVTPGNFKIEGGFKFGKFKYYTSSEFPKEYKFQTGDLVVSMTDLSVDGDSLGSPAFIPQNKSNEIYLHNQRVGRVIFKETISNHFIFQLMKTEEYRWFILGGASGTAIRHTSPKSICSFQFKLPPKEKLEKFDLFAKELENKIRLNQTQISTLQQLRDTMLPKLMNGEINLNLN